MKFGYAIETQTCTTTFVERGEDYILTNADAWRIRTLQESGELLEDILAELSKYTKREQQEVLEAFEDAGITAMDYDDKVYKAAGLSPVSLEQSPAMIRLMERNMNHCLGDWKNFTRTTASAAQRMYIEQCNLAYNHVMTGAVGYTQAIKWGISVLLIFTNTYQNIPKRREELNLLSSFTQPFTQSLVNYP